MSASTYPTTLDTFTDPLASDRMDVVDHADMHVLTNSAVAAVEGTLGVYPQGSSLTVAARFTAIESAGSDTAIRTIMGVY